MYSFTSQTVPDWRVMTALSQTNTRQFNSTLEAWKTNWTHSIRGNVFISHFNNPVLIGSDDDLYEEQHTLPITHNPQRLSLNTLLNFDNFIPTIYKSNENIKCVKYWKLHFCLKFTKTNIVFVPSFYYDGGKTQSRAT